MTVDPERLRSLAAYRAKFLGFGTSPEDMEEWQAAEEIAELREALNPFSDFGKNVDDNGWTSNIHREPISTWFGPSDFRIARAKIEGGSNGR